MVKLVNTTIPPDLAEAYAALISPQKKGATGSTKARTRRGAARPKRRKKRNIELLLLLEAATALARKLGLNVDSPAGKTFIYRESRDLLIGVFNEAYWQQIPLRQAKTLISVPSSTPDDNPPAYDYRRGDMLPSKPNYPNGYITTGLARYTGQITGNYFTDTSLRWRRLTFATKSQTLQASAEPLILFWLARIDISASIRASKPMLSLQLKIRSGNTESGYAQSAEPPVNKRTTLYWRFGIPPSEPPYYNSFQMRRVTKVLNGRVQKDTTAPVDSLTLTAAPRAMLGRGFNNNTEITTQVTGDPILYGINPCLGQRTRILARGIISGQPHVAAAWYPETGDIEPLIRDGTQTNFWTHNCYFVEPSMTNKYQRYSISGDYVGNSADIMSDAGISLFSYSTGRGLLAVGKWVSQAGAEWRDIDMSYVADLTHSAAGDVCMVGGVVDTGVNQLILRAGPDQTMQIVSTMQTATAGCIAGKFAYLIKTNGDISIAQVLDADGNLINFPQWTRHSGIGAHWSNITDYGDMAVYRATNGYWRFIDSSGATYPAKAIGGSITRLYGTMCRGGTQ